MGWFMCSAFHKRSLFEEFSFHCIPAISLIFAFRVEVVTAFCSFYSTSPSPISFFSPYPCLFEESPCKMRWNLLSWPDSFQIKDNWCPQGLVLFSERMQVIPFEAFTCNPWTNLLTCKAWHYVLIGRQQRYMIPAKATVKLDSNVYWQDNNWGEIIPILIVS